MAESACKSGRKRGPAAVEPPEYVGTTKTCPNCRSSEHSVFKFLNNKKPDQPRYQCMQCKKLYTHYPPGKARPRPHGKKYAKHTLANPPEHYAMFDLRCPNPACATDNQMQPRFLYYNNKNPLQPRYRCLVCHASWQPKLWSKLPAQPDGAAPTHEHLNNVVIESAAHFDMPDVQQQQSYYNPEEAVSLRPDDPEYVAVMQSQQPPYNYLADQIVNATSCTDSYPSGDPNYMDAMQSQQVQYFDPANGVTSMESCTEIRPDGDPSYMDAMQSQQLQYFDSANNETSMESCTESHPSGDPNYMNAMQSQELQYFDPTNTVTSMESCTESPHIEIPLGADPIYKDAIYSQDVQFFDRTYRVHSMESWPEFQSHLQQQYNQTDHENPMGSRTEYANVNFMMQQPDCSESQEHVNLGGVDANINTTQVQQPISESQPGYKNLGFGDANVNMDQDLQRPYSEHVNVVKWLGDCTPDPSMSAGGSNGNPMQAGGDQSCVPSEECFASFGLKVDADTVQPGGEQPVVNAEFDPASVVFDALDADTKRVAEERYALQEAADEGEWTEAEWTVELFGSVDAP